MLGQGTEPSKTYSSGVRQGVAGYPNTGQLRFYVLFPVAMTLLGACLAVFVKNLPKSPTVKAGSGRNPSLKTGDDWFRGSIGVFSIIMCLSAIGACANFWRSGFELIRVEPRFLPRTTRSALSQAPWLVSLYLSLRPLSSAILGKQFLIVAKKAD
jgi:hypothetical protein